jgi:hypothetical protein
MAKLFNAAGPNFTVIAIEMDQCSEVLLSICNVPSKATVNLPNTTEASIIGEKIFVRGVNSSFFPVVVCGKRYYVHENFVRE